MHGFEYGRGQAERDCDELSLYLSARPWKFGVQPGEEQQIRDRQPRPTSPTAPGRMPNMVDAEPTTSRGSFIDMPDQKLIHKEPSNPNET